MAEFDPLAAQRDNAGDITAELEAAGFTDLEEIGRGGFGVVYRCRQPHLDRTVAVKVLAADPAPDGLERFLREQRAMGRLSGHPHIVTVLQVGTTPAGRPYLVMPYHRYGSLDATIRRTGPLNWADTLNLGMALAGALEAAHQAGVVHRDVKPANILLTEYGDAQLADFGIARISGGFETGTGVITGSPRSPPPRSSPGRAPPRHRTSTASARAVLRAYRARRVRTPQRRATRRPVRADHHRAGAGSADPAIPDAVTAVIGHAMAAEPTARPRTAAEFGDELRDARTRAGAHADDDPPLAGTQAEPGSRRRLRRRSSGRPPRRRPWCAGHGCSTPCGRRGGVGWCSSMRPPGTASPPSQPSGVKCSPPEGTAVAWLSVDNDDNNLVWFLAHLIEAIRRVQPTLGRDSVRYSRTTATTPTATC